MPNYSQDEILRRGEIFTTNGLKPEAQAVIAAIGFTPTEIGLGAAKVAAMIAARNDKVARDATKRKATQAEKKAFEEAQRVATQLAETCRILFADNPPALTLLGLQTRYETVTNEETGESKKVATRGPRTTAAYIGQWRQLFYGAEHLIPEEKAELTGVGWTSASLTASMALVDAYATADTAQQSAIQQAEAASATLKRAFDDLVQWYTRARRLSLIALKSADPTNSQNLIELLGLD